MKRKLKNKAERISKPRDIQSIIQASTLAQLLKKTILLDEMTQQLYHLLPEHFKGLFHLARLEPTCLTIYANNSMVRQALLFQQVQLLEALQRQDPSIQHIDIKVKPQEA